MPRSTGRNNKPLQFLREPANENFLVGSKSITSTPLVMGSDLTIGRNVVKDRVNIHIFSLARSKGVPGWNLRFQDTLVWTDKPNYAPTKVVGVSDIALSAVMV